MKLIQIVGARPQFIKMAIVSRAIIEHNNRVAQADRIEELIIHTGQHYDENMSAVFFEELEIPKPDHNLGIGSASQGAQTGRMLEAIETVLVHEQPDWVLLYGDTNSTLAGAVAAAKLHIPVAHVEAGLRSFNRKMPEEINRVLTDHASDVLFCPTETAVENLRCEGFSNAANDGNLVSDLDLHKPRTKCKHRPCCRNDSRQERRSEICSKKGHNCKELRRPYKGFSRNSRNKETERRDNQRRRNVQYSKVNFFIFLSFNSR